jgi:hypothetical protein
VSEILPLKHGLEMNNKQKKKRKEKNSFGGTRHGGAYLESKILGG